MTGTVTLWTIPNNDRDPIIEIAETLANAIRIAHGYRARGKISDMALYMGMPAYRTLMDRHEREHPSPPPSAAFVELNEEMKALPYDPNDPRLVRLREELQKRLPKKLRGKELPTW